MYVYIYIYKYKVFKEKTKTIFTQNISATAFINSLSTSRFSLMLHFKTNLQVIIYIIDINKPDSSDHKIFTKKLFYKLLKTL